MSGAGTTMSMITSIKGNTKLLNRTNMFAQIKSINNDCNKYYKYLPMSREELNAVRMQEKNQSKRNLFTRIIIGVLVIIPVSIVVMSGLVLLIQALY